MKPRTQEQKIEIAEKEVGRLSEQEELKSLSEDEKNNLAQSYEQRSKNRLETAELIYVYSSDPNKKQNEVSKEYADYGEVITASYYAMYYIVHAYLAKIYKKKLKENTYQVHAKTNYLVLYYLVKTSKLALHLYEQYIQTMATAQIQKSVDDFHDEAYRYAQKYDKCRSDRESSTYNVERIIEERHAKNALNVAQEFIVTIQELMMKR